MRKRRDTGFYAALVEVRHAEHQMQLQTMKAQLLEAREENKRLKANQDQGQEVSPTPNQLRDANAGDTPRPPLRNFFPRRISLAPPPVRLAESNLSLYVMCR